MPPRRKDSCMPRGQYIAQFNRRAPPVVVDLELSDAESRVEDPRRGNRREETGWTEVLHLATPPKETFFHDLLERTLKSYYTNLKATWEYRCREHRHPQKSSHWEAELRIFVENPATQVREEDSIHVSRVSRDTAEKCLEDVAFNALSFYIGQHYDVIQHGGLRHYPRILPGKKVWTVEIPEEPSELQATVELVRELVMKVGHLKAELLQEKRDNKQLQEENAHLKAQLEQLKANEENYKPPSA